MNIIQKIIGTYNKGLKYDELLIKHSLLEANFEEVQAYYTELVEYAESVDKKYGLLRTQYKDLLKKGVLDILSLKSWYEAKYQSRAWLYDFDGQGKKDVKLSLVVTSDGEGVLKSLSKEILVKYESETPTEVVESVLKYFSIKKNWKYMYDKDLFNKEEFWQLAEISAVTRKGDCDDLAILMHNLVYFMLKELKLDEHYWRLKLVAGTLVGYGGHAYNIWLNNDGEWYVVESTYDLSGSFNKTWLKTPIKNNNLYRSFWGFSRKDKSWVGKLSSLEPYKKR